MTKAPKRKLKTTKAERRTILKAAARPKTSWKATRKKRKPDPISRETVITTRRPRGPDLKPRKRRSTMAKAKLEGEDDEDNGKDVKGTRGTEDKDAKGDVDTRGDVPVVDPPKPPGLIVGEGEVAIYDNSSGRWKTQKAP
jgi:hypothetical protein